MGAIIGNGSHLRREEFAPLPRAPHVFDDAGNHPFVLFRCVLLVEDAVLLPVETRASETVLTRYAAEATQVQHSYNSSAMRPENA